MKEALLSLTLSVLNARVPASSGFRYAAVPAYVQAQAEGAAEDVETVISEHPEFSLLEREQWASVLYIWSGFEALWYTNPKGSNDKGAACGVMQVHTPELWLPGATCEKVRADRKLGYRVGLALLLRLRKQCGSMRGALTAFSTNGQCPAPGWTIGLVVKRCSVEHSC